VNKNTPRVKNLRQMCVLQLLDYYKKEISPIFIDQTGINLSLHKPYGYNKRNKRFVKKIVGKWKNISLCAAISERELIGYIFDGAMKSEDFSWFLINLSENLDKKKFKLNHFFCPRWCIYSLI
jgi:hypothetical protein